MIENETMRNKAAGMEQSIASSREPSLSRRPAAAPAAAACVAASVETAAALSRAPSSGSWLRSNRLPRAGAWLACFAVAVLLAGCGDFFAKSAGTTGSGTGSGSGTNTSTSDYLYVANESTTPRIAGFSLANGALASTPNSPYTPGDLPLALAITPSGSLLYVAGELQGILVYIVNSNGSLSIGNSGAPVFAVSAQALAIDPTGQWLLVVQNQLNGGAPLLSVFSINTSNGLLTQASTASSIALDGGTASQLTFVPSSTSTHLVYVTLGTDGTDALTFDTATGTLSKLNVRLNPLGNAYADNSLATNPAGNLLFISETGAGAVRGFTVNADGTLTGAGAPTVVGTGIGSVFVDATGAYLYAADRVANKIHAFSIAATGALTEISGSPYATGATPTAIVEDHSKGYLAVTCQGGSPDLELFPIDSTTGALGTPIQAATAATSPAGASSIVASP